MDDREHIGPTNACCRDERFRQRVNICSLKRVGCMVNLPTVKPMISSGVEQVAFREKVLECAW